MCIIRNQVQLAKAHKRIHVHTYTSVMFVHNTVTGLTCVQWYIVVINETDYPRFFPGLWLPSAALTLLLVGHISWSYYDIMLALHWHRCCDLWLGDNCPVTMHLFLFFFFYYSTCLAGRTHLYELIIQRLFLQITFKVTIIFAKFRYR